MRFADLLRTSVLLSAGAATALAAACVVGTVNDPGSSVAVQAVGWWLVAALIGAYLGRAAASSPVANALADARTATAMPQDRPWATVLNRLWPLLAATAVAGALAFLAPQVPGIAAGFAIIWALAWRLQDRAVTAVEERDGVTFYVEPSSPLAPVKLVRMPGLRREVPELPTTS